RPPEREHQHAGRRLRPYPLQLTEPGLRLLQGQVVEKLEIEVAPPFMDGLQRRLDPRRFYPRQAARLYLRNDLLRLRGEQFLPRPEPRPQAHERSPSV